MDWAIRLNLTIAYSIGTCVGKQEESPCTEGSEAESKDNISHNVISGVKRMVIFLGKTLKKNYFLNLNRGITQQSSV